MKLMITLSLTLLFSIPAFSKEFPIIDPYEGFEDSVATQIIKDHVIFNLNFNYPFSLNFTGSRSYDPLNLQSVCNPKAKYVIDKEVFEYIKPFDIDEVEGVTINKRYSLTFRVYSERDQRTFDGRDFNNAKYRTRGLSLLVSTDGKYIFASSSSCESFLGNYGRAPYQRLVEQRAAELPDYYSKMWFKDLL